MVGISRFDLKISSNWFNDYCIFYSFVGFGFRSIFSLQFGVDIIEFGLPLAKGKVQLHGPKLLVFSGRCCLDQGADPKGQSLSFPMDFIRIF